MNRSTMLLLLAASVFSTTAIAQGPPAPPATGASDDKSAASPAPSKDDDKELGFTWWNDVPEMVKRGNDAYGGENYERSEEYYRDARIRAPDEPVAYYNMGLALARQDKNEDARRAFDNALDLAGEDAALREKILYNKGVSHLKDAVAQAEKLKKKADDKDARKKAIESAVHSIDALHQASRIDPNDADATHNREEAQRLLEFLSQPPPPKQQQQNQSGGGDSKDQQQQQDGKQDQQQQNQQQQNQDQKQDQKQDQSQDQQQQDQDQQQPQQQQNADDQQKEDQQKQDEQKQQEQDQKQEQEAQPEQPQDGEGKDQQPAQAQQMTPEEARRLLNMLGDSQNILLRKRNARPALRPDPEKDW